MVRGLFDELYNTNLFEKRDYPATIEEFVKFGLQPEDYVRYIGLQQRLQSELLLTKNLCDCETSQSLEDLIAFCEEKRLIARAEDFPASSFCAMRASEFRNIELYWWDALYRHDWLCYPKESSEFRLTIERKFLLDYDDEEEYIADHFGAVSFDYSESTDYTNSSTVLPVRVRKYNPNTKTMDLVMRAEVKKMYEIVKADKKQIEKKIKLHRENMPKEQDVSAISSGKSWVKKWYELNDRQELVRRVYETFECALATPDVYEIKENDVLFVFCDGDTCHQNNHHILKVQASFKFYGKPDKLYTIERCSHCLRFQITLEDLITMMDDYGVPRVIIVYDEKSLDFGDFSGSSVFYENGYTVSQSTGLSVDQRQFILKQLIEKGTVSKYQTLSFLKQRMNINGMKAGNEVAFRKWKEDYEFVKKL